MGLQFTAGEFFLLTELDLRLWPERRADLREERADIRCSTTGSLQPPDSALVVPTGEVDLSPGVEGRRFSWENHMRKELERRFQRRAMCGGR